ncbi:MAG: DinB family protein [Bryobacteraceae bacterium]
MVRLENVLESWKSIRRDTAQTVEDFPQGLDFTPVEGLMTFGDLARHVLNAGHALTAALIEGEEDLSRPGFRESMKARFPPPPEGAEALARELRAVVEADAAALARQTPEFFAGIITRFDGQRVTRLEMLQFIKEHELTHRSQMFVYLRLNGLVPVTTRRRQAK